MHRKPHVNSDEEMAIEGDYPDVWDESSVDYSWKGLRFPMRPRPPGFGIPQMAQQARRQGYRELLIEPQTAKATTQRAASTTIARRRASAKYWARNEEELREKKALILTGYATLPKARARLAHRQRILRMEAYERKHGHRAWLQRYEKLEAQRAEARELEELRRYQEEFRCMDAEREKREGPPHPS
ncbi:hypothetical protein B0H13DRAFT_2355300 [Mycena leptocephala]|nr:hypothetical protein B0H13DRAFT_2355300 [Mycena leptocephala]